MLTRRRFLVISAALAPSMAMANRTDLHVETGIALGAQVTLRLHHPQAPALAAQAMGEIRRLEAIFSLYQPQSALSRLNRDGRLDEPPFELLECLTLAGAVNRATTGLFDPTVQPLWQAEAKALERARPFTDAERNELAGQIGWNRVLLTPGAISLQPGMALTLNGIAQGYIADRVASLLASHGLTRALIDTGEMVALPEGSWPVHLPDTSEFPLQGRALATSAPLGMTFGNDGKTSHILNPITGRPVQSHWQAISVSAPSAALADALSTALCLTANRDAAEAICAAFAAVKLEAAIPA